MLLLFLGRRAGSPAVFASVLGSPPTSPRSQYNFSPDVRWRRRPLPWLYRDLGPVMVGVNTYKAPKPRARGRARRMGLSLLTSVLSPAPFSRHLFRAAKSLSRMAQDSWWLPMDSSLPMPVVADQQSWQGCLQQRHV